MYRINMAGTESKSDLFAKEARFYCDIFISGVRRVVYLLSRCALGSQKRQAFEVSRSTVGHDAHRNDRRPTREDVVTFLQPAQAA